VKTIDHSEITVVGGGVIGCFIAYYLAKAGRDVVLVEKGDVGAGASGANDACIMAQSKKPGPKLKLAIHSSNTLWEGLADELDHDIEYVRKGSMLVMESEEEVEFIRAFTQAQRDFGLPVEFLDQKETRSLQPAISPHILASTFCPIDGEVNPFRLLVALVNKIHLHRGRVHTHCAVEGFKTRNGVITHVATERGDIETSVVVCAGGAYSSHLGRMVGVDIPIEPRRGQVLITEATSPLIGPYIMSAKGIMAKHSAVASAQENIGLPDFALGMIISQTASGNMVLGVTYEFAGYDTQTTMHGVTAVAKYTAAILPALGNLRLIRTFSGLRPFTREGVPIVSPSDRVPNFIIAAGHEGDGVAVSPATGMEVSQKLIEGAWPERRESREVGKEHGSLRTLS
jgi:glycine/D-amino acid oxidase-like deaminating enzyme